MQKVCLEMVGENELNIVSYYKMLDIEPGAQAKKTFRNSYSNDTIVNLVSEDNHSIKELVEHNSLKS